MDPYLFEKKKANTVNENIIYSGLHETPTFINSHFGTQTYLKNMSLGILCAVYNKCDK